MTNDRSFKRRFSPAPHRLATAHLVWPDRRSGPASAHRGPPTRLWGNVYGCSYNDVGIRKFACAHTRWEFHPFCKYRFQNHVSVGLTRFSRRGIPVWRRLIDHPPNPDERISLITNIFSDRDGIEVVRQLRGDDAQSFVDVIDEVFSHFLPHVNKPTNFSLTSLTLLSSHWAF
jgi:hypothetical protein